MSVVVALIKALVDGVPRIIELVKKGRDPGSIKLSEVISTDALKKLESAKTEAEDFIKNG